MAEKSKAIAQKSTDPKSFTPKSYVPHNPDRIKMTKKEAIEDSRKLRERDARKEQAGIAFDIEEAEKAKAKKDAKAKGKK